jgi:hypothetical protein
MAQDGEARPSRGKKGTGRARGTARPVRRRGEPRRPVKKWCVKACCRNCVYAVRPTTRWLRLSLLRWPGLGICFNKAGCDGRLEEICAEGVCRNFQARQRRQRPAEHEPPEVDPICRAGADPAAWESDAGVRRIPLTHGLFAIVDAADYEEVSQYKWCAQRRSRSVYASTGINVRTVMMHRLILRAPKGSVVDHIDGNGRSNLRLCKPGQNQLNRRSFSGSSRFVGVCLRGNRWEANIKHGRHQLCLGRFDDEVEAAKARDRKAYELHGEFAYLNFPDEIEREAG